MLKVAVILGSTRPGRIGEAVAKWVHEIASGRGDARYELIDLRDYDLPLLDEPVSAAMGRYSRPHTRAWSSKIESFDAFVFVTPEYNHGTSAALKNAIDFLFQEWNDKAAAFVGYGSAYGARAIEHLRQYMAEVKVATVRTQVGLSLYTDFENYTRFKPASRHEKTVNTLLDELLSWAGALKVLREGELAQARSA